MRAYLWQHVVGVLETNCQDVLQIRHQAGTADPRRARGINGALPDQDRLPVGHFQHTAVSEKKKTGC